MADKEKVPQFTAVEAERLLREEEARRVRECEAVINGALAEKNCRFIVALICDGNRTIPRVSIVANPSRET